MVWRDEGIVIAGRRFGKSGLILEVFTATGGKRAGLVYGGASRSKRASMEVGNSLDLEWRGRSADQLGHFSIAEVYTQRSAALLEDREGLYALASATAILSAALPETETYPQLYQASVLLLDKLGEQEVWPALYVRWEAGVLATLGFGLDLSRCALTGAETGMTHVSPRTGRAVCGSAAPEFVDKLLPLPAFLIDPSAPASPEDIGAGMRLTGYFLENRLFADMHKPPPVAREQMISRLVAKSWITA